jgi:hypothetical protein
MANSRSFKFHLRQMKLVLNLYYSPESSLGGLFVTWYAFQALQLSFHSFEITTCPAISAWRSTNCIPNPAEICHAIWQFPRIHLSTGRYVQGARWIQEYTGKENTQVPGLFNWKEMIMNPPVLFPVGGSDIGIVVGISGLTSIFRSALQTQSRNQLIHRHNPTPNSTIVLTSRRVGLNNCSLTKLDE